MSDEELLSRITSDPGVVAGQPRIRGTRLTVRYILNLISQGATIEEMLADHPSLTQEDILACLQFASTMLADDSFVPLVSAP